MVQQGTHKELMADKEGIYCAFAHAQQLSLGDNTTSMISRLDPEKQNESLKEVEKFLEQPEPVPSLEKSSRELKYGSFALFLWEQKLQWRWYSLMLIGALCIGGLSLRTIYPVAVQANSKSQLLFPCTPSSSQNLSRCLTSGGNLSKNRPISGVSCSSYWLSELLSATTSWDGPPTSSLS